MKTKLKLILSALLMMSAFVYGMEIPDIDNTSVVADSDSVPYTRKQTTIRIVPVDSNGDFIYNGTISIVTSLENTIVSKIKENFFEYRFDIEYDNNEEVDKVNTITITFNGVELHPVDVVFRKIKK